MSKRLMAMLAGVAALAILIAGCGGGEESLTKAEYVEEGSAICNRTLKEMKAELATMAKEEREDGIAPAAEREKVAMEFVEKEALPAYETELAELRDLPAPEGDEDQLNAIYDEMQQGLDQIQKNNKNFFQLTNKTLDAAREDSKKYGLEGCMLVFDEAV